MKRDSLPIELPIGMAIIYFRVKDYNSKPCHVKHLIVTAAQVFVKRMSIIRIRTFSVRKIFLPKAIFVAVLYTTTKAIAEFCSIYYCLCQYTNNIYKYTIRKIKRR
jgi:hypothetical protein